MCWNSISSWWRSNVTITTFYLLFLGQLVAFILAFTSFASSLIAHLHAPITQSTFTYASLALVYGAIFLYRRQRLQVAWYWYLLLGFVDVQGNYLFNKAFQFSSITSVTLLDCWTIAWAIILTWFFLGTRYSLWQLFGAAICVLGLGLVLLSDAWIGGGDSSRPLLGDMLVILSTVFFAMSNVGEEFFVKNRDRVEVVCMIGVYGFIVSVVQLSLLEHKSVKSIKWSSDIILGFTAFSLSSFMYYTISPFVLKLSGATMFNLSLLTSDMWAVVIRIFFYHQQVDWLYYVALSVVLIGLVVYSTTEKDPIPVPAFENGKSNVQYQIVIDENVASRDKSSDS
ncbi:hypothetical protein Ddye_007588 [Dipteronia dyeriana]|uniref:Solute carrier family 35 member F1 n=1 Tax=Dipteronia dyeriana TaxID=168575 RepID=A0AAD9XKQ4_9ROSI|nr:hypothetical protein Ddye_007588 [Dipteronia dyeriana]